MRSVGLEPTRAVSKTAPRPSNLKQIISEVCQIPVTIAYTVYTYRAVFVKNFSGVSEPIRTVDPLLRTELLYPLSYGDHIETHSSRTVSTAIN